MKRFNEIVEFSGNVIFRILPFKTDSKLNGTTPNVGNCEYWYCSGSVITITNFVGGSKNQRLFILGDGKTTISNNTNIVTNTGANKLLASNKVYRFTLFNNVWYEDS